MAYFRVPTTDKVKGLLNRRGRLEKIIDLVSSLPSSPNQGDRYVDLSDNKVKEYDGSVWQEYVPNEGDNLYVLNRDKYYYFDGTEWKDLTEIVSQWNKSGDTLTPKDADNIEINGSFIGDGSQLTGIKKLIEEFVAQGNVSAGDVVAFVNGKTKKGKVLYSDNITGFGAEYVFNSGKSIYISSDRLTFDTFVVAYSDVDNSYRGTVVVGKVNDKQVVFGNEYIFSNGITGHISISALSDNKFVIAYYSSEGKAIIGNVSDTAITFGSEYVFNGGAQDIKTSVLSSNKFVIAYQDTSNSKYGTAIIGNVSDTAITFGSEYVFNAGNTFEIDVTSLTSDKIVIAYMDNGNSNYGTAIVGNISGSFITFGSEYVFNSSQSIRIAICDLNESKFVVIFNDYSNSNKATAIIGNVNDYQIVYSNKFVYNESSSENQDIISLSSCQVLISYRDTGNNNYGTAIVGIIQNDNISFGNKYIFNSDGTHYVPIIKLTSEKFVISYEDDGNNNYGTAIVGEIENSLVKYIGISQETKNDGETTKVLIQGVSDVHSGLTVGQKYYADENGNLTTTETEDYIGIAISENKILLLDWQRPIMIYDGSNDEYIVPEKI